MLKAIVSKFNPEWGKYVIAASALRRFVSRSVSFALATGVVMGSLSTSAQTRTNAPIEFDIPSQSLNSALDRYSDATGRQGLYDASLTRDRLSGVVRGTVTPDKGLRMLLAGTGLAVEFIDETTFVLVPASVMAAQPADGQRQSGEDQRYFGLIQASLLNSFCRSRRARPAHYRFVALIWIDPDGVIRRAQRIGSTGALDMDQRIEAALRGVGVSEPPPAGFAQPVLMLIVPETTQVTGCNEMLTNHRSGQVAR